MGNGKPQKRVTLPRNGVEKGHAPRGESATAAALFGDVPKPYTGQHCIACERPKIATTIRETLLGMVGEGPAAGGVPIHLTITDMFARMTDAERCEAVGIPTYPATISAFRKHVNVCERELYARVKEAKREAGCRY